MTRIFRVATLLGFAFLLMGGVARAQETSGRITGRVTDQDTGAPLDGVTVIVQGPQGEDATVSDKAGHYEFQNLKIGTYVLRFYVANNSTQVERPGVIVSAEKTVRVNARIASTAQAAAQQTYVITGKPPLVDVGSSHIGYSFDQDFALNVPTGRTYGDLILKAPGVFVDGTGNVSIGGSTGLENIYMINGMNVTGLEMGNLETGMPSLGGGTNLPVEFIQQLDVNSGGYQAEYGGAMGGVINTVLKSGTNQWHGSVFGYDSPYWLSANPNIVTNANGAIGGRRSLDYDASLGAEIGGPIIKDKLFFWLGFAPRLDDSHVFRYVYAQREAFDSMGMSQGGQFDANGNRVQDLVQWRRFNESRRVYSFAGTMDWVVRPEHKLTLSVMGTPSFNNQLRSLGNQEFNSFFPNDPNGDAWGRESLTKTNSDVVLRWVSKFFDRHWQIEANAGLHNEYFNDRGHGPTANQLNQLEYWGANLPQIEADAPAGCAATASGFQPCSLADQYHTGGFGLTKTYTGNRWMGEIKSLHIGELAGHHEFKYGWRLELSTFDQDRYYSGPEGARNLVQIYPNGSPPSYSTYSFFTLQPGQFPTDYGPGTGQPYTDLLHGPQYQDHLRANVKELSNAFFIQDSYSPQGLRNLTVNVGVRYELQKLYDFHGSPFLDTGNFGPRLGAVYDPMNDGKSKISVGYGRFYESIPLNVAARYFGGEGILVRNNVPLSTCSSDPMSWTGAGEAFKQCDFPARGAMSDAAANGTAPFNNGTNYPVQPHLQGQYHNEIVATAERQLMDDLTARIDYTHRWLGSIIEDGTGDPSGSFAFVLANPGNIPQDALNDAKAEVAAAMAKDQSNPVNASATAAAQAKLANLQVLANAPKPERTYDAITLSLFKRFSANWQGRAAYTYSRLVGNYEGLYQATGSYFAPNGNNAYDTPDLYLNQRGRLPTDRPHQARLDGWYTYPVGKGAVTFGLSFQGQSGVPRNYISSWYFGQPQNMLLPRGSAGRTPPVTQFDGKIMYTHPVSPGVTLDAFCDLFNLFNQQATVLTDDVYTYSVSSAIVNGTPSDLPFAKDVFGNPIVPNKNFGHPIAYQAPFHARLGLRLSF
jgi:hypothetical protein